jgi:hypothetical protein
LQTLQLLTLCTHLATKRTLIQVVDEGALAVDLHHRQPLTVTRLELGVARDIDLLELEAQLVPEGDQLRTRPLAQVTAGGPVEDDVRYG